MQLDRRARERADDRAGVAGIDQQTQPGEHVADLGAAEERGRAGQPVGHRALLERDGDAPGPRCARSARARRCASGGVPSRTRRSISAATRLRLGALVGAAPEAARRPPRRSRRRAFARRSASGATTASAAMTHLAGAALRALETHASRASGSPCGGRAAFLAAAPRSAPHRLVVVDRRRQPAVLGASSVTSAQVGVIEVLGVVDERRGASAPRRAPRTCGRSAEQLTGAQDEVAEVEGAAARRAFDRGPRRAPRTRARAGAALGRRRAGWRPSAAYSAARHRGGLEPVDRGRSPRRAARRGGRGGRGGAACSSSTRSSSIARRSAGRHGHGERVDAGLERLVAEQPRADRRAPARPLAPRSRDRGRPRRRARSASAAAAVRVSSTTCSGGRRPGPPATRTERRSAGRLARARAAEHDERAAVVVDDARWAGREAVGGADTSLEYGAHDRRPRGLRRGPSLRLARRGPARR